MLAAVLGFPTAWFIGHAAAPLAPHLAVRESPFRSGPTWSYRTFAIQEVIRNEGLINNLLRWAGIIDSPIQMPTHDFAILLGNDLRLPAADGAAAVRLHGKARFSSARGRLRPLRRPAAGPRHIALPLVMPGFVAGSILVFIPAIGAYVTPRLLGGGRSLMLANLIELQFGQGRQLAPRFRPGAHALVIVLVALLFYVRTVMRDTGQRHE